MCQRSPRVVAVAVMGTPRKSLAMTVCMTRAPPWCPRPGRSPSGPARAFVGWRTAEACGLRVEDVDFMRGVVPRAVQWQGKS